MASGPRTIEPHTVLHPGETVMDYLEHYGWSQQDLSRRAGITPKTVSEICNGKTSISPATALSLEKVLQRPAHFWLNLQRQYDEAKARERVRQHAADWGSWTARFPISEMKQYRLIGVPDSQRSDTDALLSFLGVSSPESWDAVWKSANVAYRQTRKFKTSTESVAVWVRWTEILAAELEVEDFDARKLRASIEDLRSQTRRRVSEIMEPVQRICGAAGVAVVWTPQLSHTGISGCARWINDRKALIALMPRYKTDDQMWFTFFHELGHILLHKTLRTFVLDNAAEDLSDSIVDPEMQQLEDEANRFAADAIIPPKALAGFIRNQDFGNEAIHEFSEKVGVGPGLVVGRLQREGLLEYFQGNDLKQRIEVGVE